MPDFNPHMILVVGYSATGKSMSLRNLKDQDKWYLLNTEAGKFPPFKSKFKHFRISDPYQVQEAFDVGKDKEDCKGIIVDSLTFLMDMFETQYVLTSADTRRAWQDYQQFFKQLMQEKVVVFNKPTIFTAHVSDTLDEKSMDMKTCVPIKGALKGCGVEAYFSTVVAAKRVSIEVLDNFQNDMLHVTDEERELGFKYCFQTRLTKDTLGERIRSPFGMFEKNETYIDNDCQVLLEHLNNFYN